MGFARIALGGLVAGLAAASAGAGETLLWTDPQGRLHITDDAERVPADAKTEPTPNAWRGVWDDPRAEHPTASSGGSHDRTARHLRTATEELERGETVRATVLLEAVLREQPGQPDAHWYLALLDRQRGRFVSSEAHLRAFLARANADDTARRSSAERRLAALARERDLADLDAPRGPLRFRSAASDHFRIEYDASLGEASPDYAQRVVQYLEDAREEVRRQLGLVPAEPTHVVLYGKAAYIEAHQHRFSFATVGFFDGRIHVVSAAHPGGELRALLFHEYAHALYRERVGGDRPYWLNEGLAELAERSARREPALTQQDWVLLRRRIEADRWLPLADLARGFSGLGDEKARTAYLQATAAAAWIGARTTPVQRARLLDRMGAGEPVERVLAEILGVDTQGLDRALRQDVASRFPKAREDSPASAPSH